MVDFLVVVFFAVVFLVPVVVLAAVFLAVPLVLVALVVSVVAGLALRDRPAFFMPALALSASTAVGMAIAFSPFTVQIG
ncbi:hypothetical protein H6F76_27500 [Leptolyngbya sp. FACHB-321]|uniref:hypothetical protein n=1 Tax=Leptolyngbya sp. FACHB-321 TaxID=2692807 RepID=UPI001684C7DB|nr:hypothetical protein [Leptolyngbya sp. FACHB-321]MBD2038705.1 hypothetical protein [Leptolyngbya sp. FACHB-321]